MKTIFLSLGLLCLVFFGLGCTTVYAVYEPDANSIPVQQDEKDAVTSQDEQCAKDTNKDLVPQDEQITDNNTKSIIISKSEQPTEIVTSQTEQQTHVEVTQSCQSDYTDEYRCSGDWLTQKYQNTDCSYNWLFYKPCEYGCENDACNLEPSTTTITVSYVFDGDTIKLSNGEDVRLIGLNAPESGQSCSSEATDKLKQLVLGKEVVLEEDVDNKDQYGRLLRYVYVEDTFVNLEMIRWGLAHKYEYGSNTRYSSQFEQAENEAKQNESCLWKSEGINYIQDKCIYIINFHFDAAGNDNYNLNDEYVTFGNNCSYMIDMTGWTIKDETASHIYTVPSLIFQADSTFTLFTGVGTNTNSALYWGRTSGDYAAIWNNDGDTLFLRNSEGNLVLNYSYLGY